MPDSAENFFKLWEVQRDENIEDNLRKSAMMRSVTHDPLRVKLNTEGLEELRAFEY